MRRAGVVIAIAAALACAGSAAARPQDQNLPWPNLLPALPVSTKVQPHAVRNCRRASLACIDNLLTRLRTQWRVVRAAPRPPPPLAPPLHPGTQGLAGAPPPPPPPHLRHPDPR